VSAHVLVDYSHLQYSIHHTLVWIRQIFKSPLTSSWRKN